MSDLRYRAAAIVLVCGLCYTNSFSGSFHYDDFHSIEQNYAIRSLANIPAFFIDPGLFSGDADKSMYRPVLLVTYALNYAWGGYQVESYHLFNIVLHILCSLLVWRLGRFFLGSEDAALLAGLIFAAHPLATEPVNYISSRSESLAACFYLAAFYFYLTRQQEGRRPWASWLCFALALLSKEVAIGLPLALLVHDLLLHRKWNNWRVYAPFWGVVAVWLALVVGNRYLTNALASDVRVRPWWEQAWTQSKALVYYAKLVVLPWGQTVEHQFFESHSPGEAAVFLSIALMGALAMFIAWGWKKPPFAFLACWSLIALGPTLVMPLNLLVNERRLYLVMAAFAWLCGYLFSRQRLTLFYLFLLFLGMLTWARNPVWSDELSLWQDAVAKAPQMYRVQTNLGKALQVAGRSEEALVAYERALEIDQRHGDTYNNIATIYHLQGHYDAAIEWYEKARQRYPGYEEIYQNLGDAYSNKGDWDKAIEMYERALEIDDRNGGMWNNFGETLSKAGAEARAEEVFLRSILLAPELPESYNNLGNIYSARRQWDQAIERYRQALARQSGNKTPILSNLGDTYLDMGQWALAREVFEQALVLEPDNAVLHYYLGRVGRGAGDVQAAEVSLQRAIQLDPTAARAHVELAELLAAQALLDRALAHFQRAVVIDSLYSRAWYGLAQSSDRAGERAAALRAYRTFLDLWPHSDARQSLAEVRVGELERPQ